MLNFRPGLRFTEMPRDGTDRNWLKLLRRDRMSLPVTNLFNHPSGAFRMKNSVNSRFAFLAIGVVTGMCLTSIWPHEPAYAVTTDRDSRFAMTTCELSNLSDVEAVFVLDFLTGQLQGGVLNPRTGQFQYTYSRNVAVDFNIDANAEPHYAIVTGKATLPQTGRIQHAQAVVYVAELSSGRVAAYAFPYTQSGRVAAAMAMTPLDSFQFREASN
jgi:hypothetical protein